MALPATDNFNRANGALGANWTGSVGSDLTIASNVVTGAVGSDSSMYWNADTPNDAQYAQCKMNSISSGGFQGPVCRASATDWVLLDALGSSSWQIEWYNSGSFTVIGSAYATAPANNDIAKITASSTTFKGYVNGTERISGSNASAPASGRGGLYVYSSAYSVDDFEVGNLSSAVTLTVADAYTTSQSDAPKLTYSKTLAIQDSSVTTQSDSIVFASVTTLVVQEVYTTTQADAISLVYSKTLTVQDTYVVSQSDSPNLSYSKTISVSDAFTTTHTDSILLSYSKTLLIGDSYTTVHTDVPQTTYILHYNPTVDTYVGIWTNEVDGSTNLYQSVDERLTANDSDYIQSAINPDNSSVVLSLPVISDPSVSTNHSLSYRYAIDGTGTINLTVQLRQGYVSEVSPGTLIAQWIHNGIGSITTVTQTLTSDETNSITDYGSLFVRMVADEV